MSHNHSNEELARLFAERDALDEIPDEDMEDYEARLFDMVEGGRLPKIADVSPENLLKLFEPGFLNDAGPTQDSPAHPRAERTRSAATRAGIQWQQIDSGTTSELQLRESVDPPQIRSAAAHAINDQRKEPSQLENADLSAPRKRGGSFVPPCAASMPDQEPSHPHATPQRHETKKSSMLQQKQVRAQIKVLKKTEDVSVASPDAKANISVVSNVTTPAATPLVEFFGRDVLRANARRSNPAPKRSRQAFREQKARKEAEKREKAEESRMTPTEYAKKVQTKFTALLENIAKRKDAEKRLFLKGRYIFYIGGDRHVSSQRTRNKMDILRKNGAVVVPTYDPNTVTHIITEVETQLTLKALGLKSLQEIPEYIPTVTWLWVADGMLGGKPPVEFLYAAFSSRIDACSSKAPKLLTDKGREEEPDPKNTDASTILGTEKSHIAEFTVATDRDSTAMRNQQRIKANAQASSSKVQLPALKLNTSPLDSFAHDPLAEFYDQARKDRDSEWLDSIELDIGQGLNTTDNTAPVKPEKGKAVFTCDQMKINTGYCNNQFIIDKLEELMEIHKTRISEEDRWRVYSYGKAIRSIRDYPQKIQSYEEALAIKGVGQKTALKIKEIIETGALKRLLYERTDDVKAITIFKGIYGVGPHTAYKWYQSGCRTLDDVRDRKGGIVVTPIQEIGIKFYDDINSRMPRAEAAEIFHRIRKIALQLDNKLFIEIMGSYRRGKEDCGDIDILLTRPTDDGKTHAGVIHRLLKELHLRGILTEDLALPDHFEALEATYRGLCRKDVSSTRRRIDILLVPWHCRGAALLYYTGDDIFNRAIRYKAGRMGYSLNQRGLSTNVIRDANDRRRKITSGTVIASETEEEIFHMLGVPWQEPHERNRS